MIDFVPEHHRLMSVKSRVVYVQEVKTIESVPMNWDGLMNCDNVALDTIVDRKD